MRPRPLLIVAALPALCCALTAVAQNPHPKLADKSVDLDFEPIRTIEDVRGHWNLRGGFAGCKLIVSGKRATYSSWTDVVGGDVGPIEVDCAVESGVLVLATTNPDIPAKKWRLIKNGEKRWLVALFHGGSGGVGCLVLPYDEEGFANEESLFDADRRSKRR
jgi:hypothetical protein